MYKKNTSGGSAHRGRKRAPPKARKIDEYAKNPNPEDGAEFYGLVLGEKGSSRFEVRLQNDAVRICPLPKTIRRRLKAGNYVLVKEPSYNKTEGYIIEVYTDEELAELKRTGRWDMVEKDNSDAEEESSSEESSSSEEEEVHQPVINEDSI